MNLHPIFVHFPIALLTLYSALEVTKYAKDSASWKHARAILVFFGTLGAFFSLSTGETAEHLFKDSSLRSVLEMHSFLATITTWVYAVLAVSYLLSWLQEERLFSSLPHALKKPVTSILALANLILGTPLAAALAILGFIGLAFVGALGAILVYGPNFDPMTSFVYALLFGG